MPSKAFAEYPLVYEFYLKQGKIAFKNGDYDQAYHFFTQAQLVSPDADEPKELVNLIKRTLDGKVEVIPTNETTQPKAVLPPPIKTPNLRKSKTVVPKTTKPISPKPIKQKTTQKINRAQLISQALDSQEKFQPSSTSSITPEMLPIENLNQVQATDSNVNPELTSTASDKPNKIIISKDKKEPIKAPTTLKFDDKLWGEQPNMNLQLGFDTTTIIEGNSIQRFLILSPGAIEIERIDRDHILIKALRLGSTILYIWDERGRWSFDVKVIVPMDKTTVRALSASDIETSLPFTISSGLDWGSFYRGSSFSNMTRQSLSMSNRTSITGETPYGDFDTSVSVNKFNETISTDYYTVGLTDGTWGPINSYSVRGFDAQKTFSPLTVPGQSFKGISADVLTFGRKAQLSGFFGQAQDSYNFISTTSTDESTEDFNEGLRLELFPNSENNIAFNFAKGYGADRSESLKEHVYSVDAQMRMFKNWLTETEFASDSDHSANTAKTVYETDKSKLGLSYNNIHPEFKTISGSPSGSGEIGGIISFEWMPAEDVDFSSYLNLYQDLVNQNESNPDGFNYDFNVGVSNPFTTNGSLRHSLYYNTTPQETSPRTNLQYDLTYSKYFNIWNDKKLSTFLQGQYQRSRYETSAASEYDRYSTTVGYNLPLIGTFNQFSNYQYSWVDDFATNTWLTPNVFTSGFNFSQQFTDHLNSSVNFYYRNEEHTEGINSFLGGEDSISGGITTTFSPSSDFEIYLTGQVRNVWKEKEGNAAYNELDVRTGVRTSLETPFAWTPIGRIEGYVYKDVNANNAREFDEPGIPNIKIKVGKKEVKTNEKGYYKIKVRAKSAPIILQMESLPSGYILTTPNVSRVKLTPHTTQLVNFGTSTNTSIYGAVFVDDNGNGKPDRDEKLIASVKIKLDNKKTITSDYSGSFTFTNVKPGEHSLTIDINSIPLEYIPKIKIKKSLTLAEGATYVFYVPLIKK